MCILVILLEVGGRVGETKRLMTRLGCIDAGDCFSFFGRFYSDLVLLSDASRTARAFFFFLFFCLRES